MKALILLALAIQVQTVHGAEHTIRLAAFGRPGSPQSSAVFTLLAGERLRVDSVNYTPTEARNYTLEAVYGELPEAGSVTVGSSVTGPAIITARNRGTSGQAVVFECIVTSANPNVDPAGIITVLRSTDLQHWHPVAQVKDPSPEAFYRFSFDVKGR